MRTPTAPRPPRFLKSVVFAVAIGLLAGCDDSSNDSDAPPAPTPRSQPNILFLLADDLGFSDLGAFGGEISTPNLDTLAAEGRLLLNHHSAFTCAPTRAMINAGTDQHVTGIGNQSIKPFQRGQPGYEGFLNDRSLYLAELLGDGGYHTYIAGKWHLGDDTGQLPPDRGYERSYVLLPGVGNHFGPRPDDPVPSDSAQLGGLIQIAYREDGQPVTPPADFFSTTFYTDRLIEYIESNRGDGQPFFAFATYTAPHWPLQAPDDYIDRYQGRYDQGWEAIRQARVQRQKALGLLPADFVAHQPLPETATLPPNALLGQQDPQALPAWDALSEAQRAVFARRMEVYAAMVEHLDAEIGRLIRYLKQTGQYEDTLIVFQSDNGSEGGNWDDPQGHDNSLENLGRHGSYVGLLGRWAEATSAPFRPWKSHASEGGHSVPTIVRLPGQVSARPPVTTLTGIQDWLPTFLEVAGIDNPGASYKGREVNPITGVSLLAVLDDRATEVRGPSDVLANEQDNRRFVQKDGWKALFNNPPIGTGDWQLFDLRNDRGETTDLADQRPDVLDDLLVEWEGYVDRFGVILPPTEATP
ncbi:MAG: arylsulfatase [Pseudomonadota bacterium]|jgi:arylsulfatase A-like enzyme|nr:arylsulfatase [Pseudomonadota bacterium]